MMIRTAGGPGLVSPFDYNERKTPRFSRTTWVALAVVAAGHVGLGAALYYQRFEMELPIQEEPRTTILELIKPIPKPPEPVLAPERPQPPNTSVNNLPAEPLTTDTIAMADGETVTESTSITTAETVREPVVDSVGTEPVRQPPAVITNPRWERQPSADQLMRAYPDRALEAGVGGRATMNCLVQPNGRVADCNLTGETPGGHGFGRAAQGLTRHFQISPRTVNGAPEGSRVNIAIRFNPPPAE